MEYHRNDGINSKRQVLIQPNIGLDREVRLSVVELLNITLADEAVLNTKTRNAHWNGQGAVSFELKTLFETQSQLLSQISDDLAERARILGGFAIGSLAEFLSHTRLEEYPGDVPDVLRLLADHEASIRLLREDTRKCTEEYDDVVTFDLLVSIMRLHEKMAWMLRSYIETESLSCKEPAA